MDEILIQIASQMPIAAILMFWVSVSEKRAQSALERLEAAHARYREDLLDCYRRKDD